MRIAIFGGSFDPVHRGHTAIAELTIAQLKLDKLFFVPTAISQYKPQGAHVKAQNRVEMLELVLPPKCEISHFEINRGGISYTKDTIAYFVQKYPQAEIFLVIGSDNLISLHKWEAIDEIIKHAKIVVYRRSTKFSLANAKRFKAHMLDGSIFEYASSDFHRGAMNVVEPVVLDYIAKHNFYLEVITKNMMKPQKFIHAKAVAKQAVVYARALKCDPKRAFLAGLVHDIAKNFDAAQNAYFLQKYELVGTPSYLVHSVLGAAWLRYEYKMQDEEIINAVMKHTTLALNLSPLDQIIFAADKLAIGRRFAGIQRLRQLINTDFAAGFSELVRYQEKIIKEKATLSQEQQAIFEKWGKG